MAVVIKIKAEIGREPGWESSFTKFLIELEKFEHTELEFVEKETTVDMVATAYKPERSETKWSDLVLDLHGFLSKEAGFEGFEFKVQNT